MKNSEDFYYLSWEQYQEVAIKISSQIKTFLNSNDIKIDYIVPILRGGGVLAISLSHLLGITAIIPIQYKYMYDYKNDNKYIPIELFSAIHNIDKQKTCWILVTEGNHCTGQTSQMCINKIKNEVPNCKICYVSIGRDYSFIKPLNGTNFELYGFLTNESEALSQEECNNLSIINKFCVYPWENINEELKEVNSSLIYHKNAEA